MFIEKHLRASKSISKGHDLERLASLKYHCKSNSIPILVSAKLLRRKNLGQIDIAIYTLKQIQVIEVKSSSIGILASSKQKNRLYQSAQYLSSIFLKKTTLLFHSSTKEKLGNHFLS